MAKIKNMFLGGLDMSFNPLSTPDVQNTIFSALNATIDTKIGNEKVLQQDFGNGKVESAYLPNGYVPLGIKEHGGIIYVVSYNPFTKHGQVGSFPSPERNISSIDIKDNTELSINWSDFYDEENGIFKTHNRLFPLGEDTILNPGDEFLLYMIYNFTDNTQKVDQLKDLISNNDIKLLKFKLYARMTNGSLVDLTDNEIPSENVRDIFDLDGDGKNDYQIYFNENGTININEFLAGFQRGESPYLVWNKKFKGKLVLSVDIEVVESFDVAIDTEKDSLTGDVIITFTPSVDDPHYKLWSEGVNYDGENIKIDGEGEQYKGGIRVVIDNNSDIKYFECDGDNNSYQIRVSDFDDNDHVLSYKVAPYMYCGVVDNLELSGSIDLNKVNSGIYELTKWRYYNTNTQTDPVVSLTYSVDYYPLKGKYISDVKFRLTNLLDDSDSIEVKSTGGYKLGTYTQEFTGLQPDSLYMVEMIIEERNSDGSYCERKDNILRVKFINTTEMYNGYLLDDSVLDYTTLPPEAKMIAESNLSLSKINLKEDNVFDPENVYMVVDDTPLYGCMYNNNKYKLSNTWSFRPNYGLFTINVFDIDTTTEYKYSTVKSDHIISTTQYTDSLFKGVSIDTKKYSNEADIETLMSNKNDRANIWEVLYKDDNDNYFFYLHNPATTNAGNSDKRIKETIDIDYKIESLTSKYFAQSFWGSMYKDQNNEYTINWKDITGDPEGENEYISGNYKFMFALAYKEGSEGRNSVIHRYMTMYTWADQDEISKKTDKSDKFPMYVDEGAYHQFSNVSDCWKVSSYYGEAGTYCSMNSDTALNKNSLDRLIESNSYPVATLNCLGVNFINKSNSNHGDDVDIDGWPNVLMNRNHGVGAANDTIYSPMYFHDSSSKKWYGNYNNDGVFIAPMAPFYLSVVVDKYTKIRNYDLDNRDICYFSFSPDPSTSYETQRYADCNLFCMGLRYNNPILNGYERYASTVQDIVAFPPRYDEVFGAESSFKNFFANRKTTVASALWGLMTPFYNLPFVPVKKNNQPQIYGDYSYTRFSHVDQQACQGKPILNLFSKIYAPQKVENEQMEFNIQKDITYDESYKLTTTINADIKNDRALFGQIFWRRKKFNENIQDKIVDILNQYKEITIDSVSYNYYDDSVCDGGLINQTNIIIENYDCSKQLDTLELVNSQKKIVTMCPDSEKLVNMFNSNQINIIAKLPNGTYTTFDSEGVMFDDSSFYSLPEYIDNYDGSNGIVKLKDDLIVSEITMFNAYDMHIKYKFERDSYGECKIIKSTAEELNPGKFSKDIIRKIKLSFIPERWSLKTNSKINKKTVCINPDKIGPSVSKFGIHAFKAGQNTNRRINGRHTGWCIAGGNAYSFDYDKNTEVKKSKKNKAAERNMYDDDVYCYESTLFLHPDPDRSFIKMYDIFNTEELTDKQ